MTNIRIWHDGGEIKGGVTFDYRGYSISFSSIAQPPEIIVFESAESTKDYGRFMGTINGLKEAFECIDILSEMPMHDEPDVDELQEHQDFAHDDDFSNISAKDVL